MEQKYINQTIIAEQSETLFSLLVLVVAAIDVHIVKYATNFHVQKFFQMPLWIEPAMIYSDSSSWENV